LCYFSVVDFSTHFRSVSVVLGTPAYARQLPSDTI